MSDQPAIKQSVLDGIQHLLGDGDGECVEALQLGGWVVLESQIGPGDEIIILGGRNFSTISRHFDQPVRAIVDGVSSNNMVGIELVTEGVKSRDGHTWESHKHLSGWFDIMWDTYLIRRTRLASRLAQIVRINPSHIFLSNAYIINLEKENEWCYFGRLTADNEKGSSQWRVWSKTEWTKVAEE